MTSESKPTTRRRRRGSSHCARKSGLIGYEGGNDGHARLLASSIMCSILAGKTEYPAFVKNLEREGSVDVVSS
jgi:hypothetical protein